MRIGRYLLLRRLGRGGMAEVWQARAVDARSGAAPVVVKRMLPHLAQRSDVRGDVRRRGARARAAGPPEHPGALRRGPRRLRALSRHGAHRRRQPGDPGARRAARRRARLRRAGRVRVARGAARARLRARPARRARAHLGRHSSRRHAEQRDALLRREREVDRLRHREAVERARARPDRPGRDQRQARLHGARAIRARPQDRRARRPVRGRRDAARALERTAAVSRQHRRGAHPARAQRRDRAAVAQQSRRERRARRGVPARARPRPRGSLRRRRGDGAGARGRDGGRGLGSRAGGPLPVRSLRQPAGGLGGFVAADAGGQAADRERLSPAVPAARPAIEKATVLAIALAVACLALVCVCLGDAAAATAARRCARAAGRSAAQPLSLAFGADPVERRPRAAPMVAPSSPAARHRRHHAIAKRPRPSEQIARGDVVDPFR